MSIPYKAWKEKELEGIQHLVSYTKPRVRHYHQLIEHSDPGTIIESEVRFKDIYYIGRIWRHPEGGEYCMRLYMAESFDTFAWLPTPQWVHDGDFARSALHIANQWFDQQSHRLNSLCAELEAERKRRGVTEDDTYFTSVDKSPISFREQQKMLTDSRHYWHKIKRLCEKYEVGEVDFINET